MKVPSPRRAHASIALVLVALVAVASRVATPANAGTNTSVPLPGQTPKSASSPSPIPKPAGTPHPFSLSIVSIDPAAPVAGQSMTIHYVVRNLAPGTVLAHLSATIGGGFPQTANGKPPVDESFLGDRSANGTLAIAAGAAGSVPIELTLSTSPCGAAAAANPACAATIFARAIETVAVGTPPIAPTERVRIAGTSYANVHHGSSNDGVVPDSGYIFVVHDPDCSTHFSEGKNGDDTFFKKKDLPAGAKLRAVDFSMYRVPPTLKTQYYGGGVGGYGSYGTKLEHDSGDALHVHWENACDGPYRTYPVVYSISFEIDAPNGMGLGETSTLASAQPYPPKSTNYTSLGVISGSTNAAAAAIPGPVGLDMKWNGEAFGATFAPPGAGTISAVYNNEPYPVTLVGDRRLGAGCGPEGNVVLAAHSTTTASEFATLYGSAPVRSPKEFTACSSQNPQDKNGTLVFTLTFLAD